MERGRINRALHRDSFDAASVRRDPVRQLLLPLLLQQIVSLEQRLEDEVVLRVTIIQQLLLDGRQLQLVDAEQATFRLSEASLPTHRL